MIIYVMSIEDVGLIHPSVQICITSEHVWNSWKFHFRALGAAVFIFLFYFSLQSGFFLHHKLQMYCFKTILKPLLNLLSVFCMPRQLNYAFLHQVPAVLQWTCPIDVFYWSLNSFCWKSSIIQQAVIMGFIEQSKK